MEAFVQMTGYVGGDVTYRTNTVSVADFRLACTPRIQRGTDWVDGETTWLTVKAFRGLADHVAASVHRGDAVIVMGRLRTAVWSKEGVTYERLELDAVTVGHDLRRGTSSFRRATRSTPDQAEPDDPGPGAPAEAEAA